MTNMALIIEDMKKDYSILQEEFKSHMDQLIKINQGQTNTTKKRTIQTRKLSS